MQKCECLTVGSPISYIHQPLFVLSKIPGMQNEETCDVGTISTINETGVFNRYWGKLLPEIGNTTARHLSSELCHPRTVRHAYIHTVHTYHRHLRPPTMLTMAASPSSYSAPLWCNCTSAPVWPMSFAPALWRCGNSPVEVMEWAGAPRPSLSWLRITL